MKVEIPGYIFLEKTGSAVLDETGGLVLGSVVESGEPLRSDCLSVAPSWDWLCDCFGSGDDGAGSGIAKSFPFPALIQGQENAMLSHSSFSSALSLLPLV